MKEIVINCAKISSMAEMHAVLERELRFPGWYGRNLDALHDCLTAIHTETRITFLHFPSLPFRSAGLLRVLRDSENENPHLEISLMTN
jgi:ribonuclease inhibitor